MNDGGEKCCWESAKGMKEKEFCERRKDDGIQVEGRKKVNEFYSQTGGVWKGCGDNDLNKKKKAEWEDAEMDPEIQHLIETMWEVDNCPPSLIGDITLQVNKTQEPRLGWPPRKLKKIYKIEHHVTYH